MYVHVVVYFDSTYILQDMQNVYDTSHLTVIHMYIYTYTSYARAEQIVMRDVLTLSMKASHVYSVL